MIFAEWPDSRTEPGFRVGQPYRSDKPYQFADTITEAVVLAAAISMKSGQSVEVGRVIPKGGGLMENYSIMNTSASHFDWRRISPETALLLQSFASELVPGVESMYPPQPTEGPPR